MTLDVFTLSCVHIYLFYVVFLFILFEILNLERIIGFNIAKSSEMLDRKCFTYVFIKFFIGEGYIIEIVVYVIAKCFVHNFYKKFKCCFFHSIAHASSASFALSLDL